MHRRKVGKTMAGAVFLTYVSVCSFDVPAAEEQLELNVSMSSY